MRGHFRYSMQELGELENLHKCLLFSITNFSQMHVEYHQEFPQTLHIVPNNTPKGNMNGTSREVLEGNSW